MLTQILFTLAVAVVVLYGFRAFDRIRKQRDAAERRAEDAARKALTAEDLVRCPQCGSYSAGSDAPPCDRTDCPVATRGKR